LIRFGIEFVPREPYWKIAFYAIQAERLGFRNLWITDHFTNRNVYTTLSIVASYTNNITLGPGVTNPYLVHPVVTAQAVASLDEIAPGRVVCGIAVGDRSTLANVGVEQVSPLAHVREAIAIIRQMTSGKAAKLEGRAFRISNARLLFSIRGRIPIYVGAQGPKMLALAGEIGDGVLINASHPDDIGIAVNSAKKGIEQSGRPASEVDMAAYTAFSVADDQEQAVKAAIPVVAFIAAGAPAELLKRHGIEPGTGARIREAIAQARWMDAFSQVSREMVDSFSICGTVDSCVEKIEKISKLGIDQFVVGSPIGPSVHKSIELVGTKILPQFAN